MWVPRKVFALGRLVYSGTFFRRSTEDTWTLLTSRYIIAMIVHNPERAIIYGFIDMAFK